MHLAFPLLTNFQIDTCQKYKNKITCPMCRKLLIEPHRYDPQVLHALTHRTLASFDPREHDLDVFSSVAYRDFPQSMRAELALMFSRNDAE